MYTEKSLLSLQEDHIAKISFWVDHRRKILIGYEVKKSFFANIIKKVLKNIKTKENG